MGRDKGRKGRRDMTRTRRKKKNVAEYVYRRFRYTQHTLVWHLAVQEWKGGWTSAGGMGLVMDRWSCVSWSGAWWWSG